MEEEKKEGFKFVDKRKREQEEVEEEKEEVKEEEKVIEESPQAEIVSIKDILIWFTNILIGNTWVWLGLVEHPETHQFHKDLTQAKISIDCIEFFLNKLDGFLSELEKRELRSIIAELQINFVNQSKLL
jgi:hypothetical protein